MNCQSSTKTTTPITDPLLLTGSAPAPSHTPAVITALVSGTIFGFVIQKGHVFEPAYIFDQLVFRRFIMLKMFMSAAAFSLFVTAALALSGPAGKRLVGGARKWAFSGYRGPVAAALGGFILGCGMALAGACPGTSPVQLGAGVKWAAATFLGGIAGAFVFGLIEPAMLQSCGILKLGLFSKPTWDTVFPSLGFPTIAILLGTVFGAVVLAVESVVPWKKDLSLPVGLAESDLTTSFSSYAWSPITAGVIVGLLQLPMLLRVHDTLGASRAYVTLVANAIHMAPGVKAVCHNSYFAGTLCGTSNWTQVSYVLASVFGGFLASMSSSTFGAAASFGIMRSFFGGFLTVFGGRMAGGCTSGQGLSGNAVLGLISPIATAFMFIGGFAAAVFLK